jgi:hypothetical protein
MAMTQVQEINNSNVNAVNDNAQANADSLPVNTKKQPAIYPPSDLSGTDLNNLSAQSGTPNLTTGSTPASTITPHARDAVNRENQSIDLATSLGAKSPALSPAPSVKLAGKQAGSIADLAHHLQSNESSDEKWNAVGAYAKNTAFDGISFAGKKAEEKDIFQFGEKGKPGYGMITSVPALVDSGITTFKGVEKGDPYQTVQGATGIAGTVIGAVAPTSAAGPVLGGISTSMLGLSQAHDFASGVKDFNEKTILNKDENEKYDYTWTAKGNQNGTTSAGVNTLNLGSDGRPTQAMLDTPQNGSVQPFTATDVFRYENISPDKAGAVDNNAYDTNPKENSSGWTSYGNGYVGFKTSDSKKPDGSSPANANNLIYTSNNGLTNVMGTDNTSVDDVNPGGKGLPGNDKIVSTSGQGTKINAGAGNDIVSITGNESKVDGGPGSDYLNIRNNGGNTLDAHGNVGVLNGKTSADNFEAYGFHGRGNTLKTDLPVPGQQSVLVQSDTRGNTLELKPQRQEDVNPAVVQQTDRVATEGQIGYRVYTPLPDQTTINGRPVAETQNFDARRA